MNENGALDIIRSAAEEAKELEAENARLRSQRDALREALENLTGICDNVGSPEWEGWGWVRDGIARAVAALEATKEPV